MVEWIATHRTTSESKNERHDDNSNNSADLDAGQPEFEFSEESDAEIIDGKDDDQEHSDVDSGIDFVSWRPILNDQCGGS